MNTLIYTCSKSQCRWSGFEKDLKPAPVKKGERSSGRLGCGKCGNSVLLKRPFIRN